MAENSTSTSRSPTYLAIQFVAVIVLFVITPLILQPGSKLTQLEKVQNSGELKVISRNGPTTYYEGSQGLDGFEYRLTKAFADSLGVRLKIVEEEDLSRVIKDIGSERGHMAAAGLTVTRERRKLIRFTQPYLEITQQLLYREGNKKPKNVEDLYGTNLLVIKGSAHAEKLQDLRKEHPQLAWKERPDIEMIDLMEMVHNGIIDHAIVDSNAFDINRAVYPLAQVAFDISEPQYLAWAFPQSADDSLYDLADTFIIESVGNGSIEELTEWYYGHVNEVNTFGALTFSNRIQTRLPRWESYMKQAAEENDLDWRLLAAISYQESHWNPKARSYTGVRGLMMLTKVTAKEVGVTDRVDPQQSIEGGARYFKSIYDRIPEDIEDPDRTWFSLAAYNVGFGHLEDARVLTERHGDDPDKWTDVMKYLPLLAKRKYYRTVKHGYARGWEPVKYVQNIRSFYSILAWHEKSEFREISLSSSVNAEELSYDVEEIHAENTL
ncbi:MAG: membrane-bound lytic murein transglycosylase MltF [Candidatus Pelagadaptatus aseana]|uniref:membrane-bound lytic murein transglycosylase MltF n=1 Tax=Candidatus Pelagadaptatus aseana TaxID=3120508 RepID=UPI0039B2DEB4